jgi:hypothetical protein
MIAERGSSMPYAVAGESGIALAEIHPTKVRMMGIRRPIPALEGHLRWLVWRLRRIVPLLPSTTKSPTRIFIAGCARSGTTLTQNLMACFDDIHVHRAEAQYQSLLELDRPETNLVVKRTAESHEHLSHRPASVGLIYCVRHPFDVLTSSHPVSVHLRRFHVTTARWEAEYDGLMRLREAQPERTILYLRYEDLIAARMSLRRALPARSAFHREFASARIRAIRSGRPRSENGKGTKSSGPISMACRRHFLLASKASAASSATRCRPTRPDKR